MKRELSGSHDSGMIARGSDIRAGRRTAQIARPMISLADDGQLGAAGLREGGETRAQVEADSLAVAGEQRMQAAALVERDGEHLRLGGRPQDELRSRWP